MALWALRAMFLVAVMPIVADAASFTDAIPYRTVANSAVVTAIRATFRGPISVERTGVWHANGRSYLLVMFDEAIDSNSDNVYIAALRKIDGKLTLSASTERFYQGRSNYFVRSFDFSRYASADRSPLFGVRSWQPIARARIEDLELFRLHGSQLKSVGFLGPIAAYNAQRDLHDSLMYAGPSRLVYEIGGKAIGLDELLLLEAGLKPLP